MKAIVALVFAVAMPWTACAKDGYHFPMKTFSICKGQFEDKCYPHDFYVDCDHSETPIIEQECTVYENGEARVRPYTKSNKSRSGNRCGYAQWIVQCAAQ